MQLWVNTSSSLFTVEKVVVDDIFLGLFENDESKSVWTLQFKSKHGAQEALKYITECLSKVSKSYNHGGVFTIDLNDQTKLDSRITRNLERIIQIPHRIIS